jgi:hypothetical protein
MRRLGAAVLTVFFPVLAGCVSFAIEGSRDNLPRTLLNVRKLETGRTTLREALERLGPPDLLLRVRDLDRLYYVSWDSLQFKFSISAPVPFPGRSLSTDAFILGVGSEEFRLARLEFDRQGILRYVQTGDFVSSSHGEYFAIDNRIVETFLEDRARALGMTEPDDDDDDLDPPKGAGK